jgi:hypothetical protein
MILAEKAFQVGRLAARYKALICNDLLVQALAARVDDIGLIDL